MPELERPTTKRPDNWEEMLKDIPKHIITGETKIYPGAKQLRDRLVEGNKAVWFRNVKFKDAFTPQHRDQEYWDEYFMDVAKRTSVLSRCVGAKNGAVIAKNRRILATGYNGSPPGSSLCQTDMYCPRRESGFQSGARRDLCPAIHSEVNAILNAETTDLVGSTMYVYAPIGICKDCAAHIVAKGITRVVTLSTTCYDELTPFFFEQAGIRWDVMSAEYHKKNALEMNPEEDAKRPRFDVMPYIPRSTDKCWDCHKDTVFGPIRRGDTFGNG